MGVSVASNLLKIGAEHTVSHSNLKADFRKVSVPSGFTSRLFMLVCTGGTCYSRPQAQVLASGAQRWARYCAELGTVLSSRFIMLTVAHQLPRVGESESGVCVLWGWGDMVQACGSF